MWMGGMQGKKKTKKKSEKREAGEKEKESGGVKCCINSGPEKGKGGGEKWMELR